MIKRFLVSVKRLSRYNVQASVIEDGEEGNTMEGARVKMMARRGKKKACHRRRYARLNTSTDIGMAGDEDDDGASVEEGNGVGDGEESKKDKSPSEPMTGRESSSTFMMDNTGEPELHLARINILHSSVAALKQSTDIKRAESGSPISRPPKLPILQVLPYRCLEDK